MHAEHEEDDLTPSGRPHIKIQRPEDVLSTGLVSADAETTALALSEGPIKDLSHHHLAIMDFMLANPNVPGWAVANAFNRTQSWLSTVVNSDLFQVKLAERRGRMEAEQSAELSAKLFRMTNRGLDALAHAVEDEETSVAEKRAITRLGLEAAGMLAHGKSGPSVVVNNTAQAGAVAANANAVSEARDRILRQSKLSATLLTDSRDVAVQ